jgi:UV DNA damage endonuclease
MIRIGYACVNTRLPAPNRTCRLKNATPANLTALAAENIARLRPIFEWNLLHRIGVFRISSDIIPFASHPANRIPWWNLFARELSSLGSFIRAHGMRVSMHPGQFTVLNSPHRKVVENSVRELAYHARFLDALDLNESHKIVVHLGGIYGDKRSSLERFMAVHRQLSAAVRARLVIENDERCYSIADALAASKAIRSPVVFDLFHHRWNPSLRERPLPAIVKITGRTWRGRDGRPKLHYSDQWPGMPPGSHSRTIRTAGFLQFYDTISDLDLDIMFEVKDKERSVLKVARALAGREAAAGLKARRGTRAGSPSKAAETTSNRLP